MSLIRKNNVLFPSLFNEFLKPDWLGGVEHFAGNTPAVNIKANDESFELELAVPGRKKDDFNIEVDEHVLTISSEVEKDVKHSEGNFTRREFSYNSFRREFTLPETIDEDKIKASYEDGILKLILPKKDEALPKPKRLIAIGK